MDVKTQIIIRSNPNIYRYLREESYWYKYLNRNPMNYDKFVKTMKEQYKIRPTDKINEVVENIDLVSNILNVIR